jgi:hypothetical protein
MGDLGGTAAGPLALRVREMAPGPGNGQWAATWRTSLRPTIGVRRAVARLTAGRGAR